MATIPLPNRPGVGQTTPLPTRSIEATTAPIRNATRAITSSADTISQSFAERSRKVLEAKSKHKEEQYKADLNLVALDNGLREKAASNAFTTGAARSEPNEIQGLFDKIMGARNKEFNESISEMRQEDQDRLVKEHQIRRASQAIDIQTTIAKRTSEKSVGMAELTLSRHYLDEGMEEEVMTAESILRDNLPDEEAETKIHRLRSVAIFGKLSEDYSVLDSPEQFELARAGLKEFAPDLGAGHEQALKNVILGRERTFIRNTAQFEATYMRAYLRGEPMLPDDVDDAIASGLTSTERLTEIDEMYAPILEKNTNEKDFRVFKSTTWPILRDQFEEMLGGSTKNASITLEAIKGMEMKVRQFAKNPRELSWALNQVNSLAMGTMGELDDSHPFWSDTLGNHISDNVPSAMRDEAAAVFASEMSNLAKLSERVKKDFPLYETATRMEEEVAKLFRDKKNPPTKTEIDAAVNAVFIETVVSPTILEAFGREVFMLNPETGKTHAIPLSKAAAAIEAGYTLK